MKLIKKTLLLGLLGLAISVQAIAGPGIKTSQNLLKNKEWGFLPNKGQLADEHGNALSDVRYYGHQGGVQLYCRANKISFVFTKVLKQESNISESTGQTVLPKGLRHENHQNDKVYSSRADMVLVGANPNAAIIASEEQAYYENYYLAKPIMNDISNVHTYKTLTYQNIYLHIDLVLHSRPQGMKYEFVVNPGGKVNDIQMQWYGLACAQLMANGGITYSMRLDHDKAGMQESAPLSYTRQEKVNSQFIKSGNRIGFMIGKYDRNETLTIDPELDWGTYFGGEDQDFGVKARVDASGNIILYGYTFSTTGIATTGSYQTSLTGVEDLYLAKFSNTGRLIWCTYYGASGTMEAKGLALDASGNMYITGSCNATGLATSGAYQSKFGGNDDGFLAKFDSSGSRAWATYIGGSGDDFTQGVDLDSAGNIFVSGTAQSKGLATSGAYKTSFVGIVYSSFLAKFSNTGSLSWLTYFGTQGNTNSGGLVVDKSGSVYISGNTVATDIATSGAYITAISTSDDAYLARFSTNGTIIWATYFGDRASDFGIALACDASGNVLMGGHTTSDGLASSGAYQTARNGKGYEVFIAKFSSSGALLWATYYGGTKSETLYSICTDVDQSIYICGETASTNGIASANAYQDSLGGSIDVFMAKFDKSGNLIWGTYYGGTNTEYGYDICVDPFKNIYLTGYTSSANAIATDSAFQSVPSTTSAGAIHAFLSKFSAPLANDAGLVALKSPNGNVCVGNTGTVVCLKNFGSKPLTSVTIGSRIDGVAQKDYHWTGKLASGDTISVSLKNAVYYSQGPHNIKEYTSMPNGVNDSMQGNDTISSTFTSHPLADASWTAQQKLNLNYHFQVKDSSLSPSYYTWVLGDGYHYNGFSFNHTFAKTGPCEVKLTVTNNFGCVNAEDSSLQISNSGISPAQQTDFYNINIYPNPFRDKTIIHFNNPQAAMVKISISDMLGKELYSIASKQYNAGDNEIEINGAAIGLAGGTYFVNMMLGDDMVVRKVVVMGR